MQICFIWKTFQINCICRWKKLAKSGLILNLSLKFEQENVMTFVKSNHDQKHFVRLDRKMWPIPENYRILDLLKNLNN